MIFVILNTQVLNTLINLNSVNLPFTQKPAEVFTTVFTPKLGLQVLPVEVKSMLNLLEKIDIEDYRISELLKNQTFIYQRIVEAAWPKKYSDLSHYVFILADELTSCEIISTEGTIAITECN